MGTQLLIRRPPNYLVDDRQGKRAGSSQETNIGFARPWENSTNYILQFLAPVLDGITTRIVAAIGAVIPLNSHFAISHYYAKTGIIEFLLPDL